MAIPYIPEWSKQVGITTWTRFEIPEDPIDITIFGPLAAFKPQTRVAYYGRVAESPRECLLVVGWKSPDAYDAFQKSVHYEESMTNLRAQSIPAVEPQTQVAVFSRSWFNMSFGPNSEVLTAYFPSSTPPETQQAVLTTERLVHTVERKSRKSWFWCHSLSERLTRISVTHPREFKDFPLSLPGLEKAWKHHQLGDPPSIRS